MLPPPLYLCGRTRTELTKICLKDEISNVLQATNMKLYQTTVIRLIKTVCVKGKRTIILSTLKSTLKVVGGI